ncbi:MAG: rhamnogalacturonan acetylesterase [Bacteroidetes bacterium]|nr:rhamnogalacturonan acetylesterase [Bacteroidota bacterium]MBS1931878.1 rhamnogalacturonan acetylesterase [Bacteroidota bacterium]
MKNIIGTGIFITLFSIPTPRNKITVFIAGDSTAANKEVKAYPETGWGMPFAYFFDSTVTVDNRAKNGRSTRTFISEGLWKKLIDDVKEGDYVLIQFGHNDEVKEKTDRYTPPDEFKINLARFITETRNKKAIPVLITPVTRRQFDSAGNIKETHKLYSDIVREVAQQYNVALIDLDEKSRALVQKFGPENSRLLYMQLEPGEHPNYPEGRNDNTHFNELGARKMAELVLWSIKDLHLDLANHIRPPLPVKK